VHSTGGLQPSNTYCWRTSPSASVRPLAGQLPQTCRRIISAAEVTDSVAIHPGYGFLSENADFRGAGLEKKERPSVFVGPKGGDHPHDGRQRSRPIRVMKVARGCRACPVPTGRWARDPDEEPAHRSRHWLSDHQSRHRAVAGGRGHAGSYTARASLSETRSASPRPRRRAAIRQ